jgi:hypothetical protein
LLADWSSISGAVAVVVGCCSTVNRPAWLTPQALWVTHAAFST